MNCNLNNMIMAGKIHHNVNNYIRDIIKPNTSLLELANNIENKIKDLTNYNKNSPLDYGVLFLLVYLLIIVLLIGHQN